MTTTTRKTLTEEREAKFRAFAAETGLGEEEYVSDVARELLAEIDALRASPPSMPVETVAMAIVDEVVDACATACLNDCECGASIRGCVDVESIVARHLSAQPAPVEAGKVALPVIETCSRCAYCHIVREPNGPPGGYDACARDDDRHTKRHEPPPSWCSLRKAGA